MKYCFWIALLLITTSVFAQNLQLHNDFRHSIDPDNNSRDYTTLSFETFRLESYGSMFMKMDVDFKGAHNNPGNLFTQISHTFKFWDFPAFLHLEYSGGLGVDSKSGYGYAIDNAYMVGAAYPFQLGNAWWSTYLVYRYNNFTQGSHDLQYSLYWGQNFLRNKISLLGHLVLWTENKDHGDPWTAGQTGKKLLFLSEPQIWYNINKLLAIGTEIKLFYHVYSYSDGWLVYPTLAIKYNY
ncbi:MAG TPA: DUF5020 family protein [bacterium]|nr:DUF5020 family protein [bacterium]HPN43985.1 DUF5020 family protein [bacterium]